MSGEDALNWRRIHERLGAVRLSLEESPGHSAAKTERILQERAAALAGTVDDHRNVGRGFTILQFVLAQETFGIESKFVREVYPLKELTRLPGTPDFLAGILNVRGQVISAMNVKRFFNLPEKGLTDMNKVIILHNTKMEFGILVDAIVGTRSVQVDDLQAPLRSQGKQEQEYLLGVTKGPVAIIAAEKLLNDPRLAVDEEA